MQRPEKEGPARCTIPEISEVSLTGENIRATDDNIVCTDDNIVCTGGGKEFNQSEHGFGRGS